MTSRTRNNVSILALICSLSSMPSAVAQSVNIDYGDGAGIPAADYMGAGSPGVWNTLSGLSGISEALVGLDGTPISATVKLATGTGPAHTSNDSGTSGNDEKLLDDYTHGGTDLVGSILFTDLVNGLYEVIVYAWTPGSADATTFVMADCAGFDEFEIGGSWPGSLEEGVTHARFLKTVVDGTMQVCTAGGLSWEGAINGIQLMALDCNDGSNGTCTLPPDPGPCEGVCPRFYFNTCTEQCEPFTWGCCEGNANNFETFEQCQAACPSVATAIDSDQDGVDDSLDVCCDTPLSVTVDVEGRPLEDRDQDCDVDLADHDLLAAELGGPGSGMADLATFATLQATFTGTRLDDGPCCAGPLAPIDDGTGLPPGGISPIIISEIKPGEYIEIYNTTDTDIDLTAIPGWFCAPFQYVPVATPASVPAGGFMRMDWPITLTNPTEPNGELILYKDFFFTSATSVLDFVCWGSPSPSRRLTQGASSGKWSGLCAASIPQGGAIHRRVGTDGTSLDSYDVTAPPSPMSCVP